MNHPAETPVRPPPAQPRFAGPAKPERGEADVRRHVARGELEAPETILTRQLGRRGLKYTNERRDILRAVLSTHDHFDADWLFVNLRPPGAKGSKATVYRSLA